MPRKMPYVVRLPEVEEGSLTRKLLAPRTDRDHYFLSLYTQLVDCCVKGTDGEINHVAAMFAAFAMSRAGMAVVICEEALIGAYESAKWLLGWRELDWKDFVEGTEFDEELEAEYGAGDGDWYPGKVGRPPKNARGKWPVRR